MVDRQEVEEADPWQRLEADFARELGEIPKPEGPEPDCGGGAGEVSERMLTLAEVCEIVARQKSWIYERVNRGEFPAPDEGRWFHSEIMEYLADRKARRVAGTMAGRNRHPDKKAA